MTEGLDEKQIDRDPIKQFQLWFDDAIAAKLPMPDAMSLATVTPDGRPTARMVLLKQVDDEGLSSSRTIKVRKRSNWRSIRTRRSCFTGRNSIARCVLKGKSAKTSAEESRDYFKTRPRESQIGAWASPQSEVISAARGSRATGARAGRAILRS